MKQNYVKRAVSKLLSVCICVTALSGLMSAGASADTGMDSNLFENGSFETYSVGNTIDGGVVVAEHATKGTKAVKIANKNSAINQYDIQLEAGKTYLFEADLYGEATTRFNLSVYGAKSGNTQEFYSQNSGDFTGAKRWTYLIKLNAAASVRLKLENVGDNALWLDNVHVTELYVPGMIYDGDFENALPGNYAAPADIKYSGVFGTGTVTAEKAYKGTQSLKTNGGDNEEITYNVYSYVEPNTKYVLSGYAYVESGKTATIQQPQYYMYKAASDQTQTAYGNLENSQRISIAGDGNWHKFKITVTTESEINFIRFKLPVKNMAYIDDISLAKVESQSKAGVFINGGFEAPAYDLGALENVDRNPVTASLQSGNAEIVNDVKFEGEQSLKLTNNAVINQLVKIEACKEYRLKCDVYLPENETGKLCCEIYNELGTGYIDLGNGKVTNPETMTSEAVSGGKWTEISFSFNTKAASTYDARFKITATASTMYLDNFILEEITDGSEIEAGKFYNGKFENYNTVVYLGNAYDYTHFGVGGGAVAEIVEKGDNNKALKLTAVLKNDGTAADISNACINQLVKLEKDKVYEISMKIAVDEGKENALNISAVTLDENGAAKSWFFDNRKTEAVKSSDFVEVWKTFKAPETADVRFKLLMDTTDALYIDDIYITEIPNAEMMKFGFEFDYGTPGTVTAGKTYRASSPMGKVIAATYSNGVLTDVKLADSDIVSFAAGESDSEVKLFTFDGMSSLHPLNDGLTLSVAAEN